MLSFDPGRLNGEAATVRRPAAAPRPSEPGDPVRSSGTSALPGLFQRLKLVPTRKKCALPSPWRVADLRLDAPSRDAATAHNTPENSTVFQAQTRNNTVENQATTECQSKRTK